MKIARFEKDGRAQYGVVKESAVSVIEGVPFGAVAETGEVIPLNDVKLLAPTVPKNIVAVGLNYRSHAKEIGMPLRDEPLVFSKFISSVINPLDQIVKPDVCKRLDYEAELAIVIGKTCARVKAADAKQYILGYTCLNDVTARDLQETDGQWARCKGFDTFCPFGPWIETDIDPDRTRVEAVLNGETVQEAPTTDFIFDTAFLVEYVSAFMTLYPGDIISTGTPGGIGPMKSGDEIKIVVEGIGELINTVQ